MSERDALIRAAYLLDVVAVFLRTHPVGDYTIIYDDAVCDGRRLAEDCRAASMGVYVTLEGRTR